MDRYCPHCNEDVSKEIETKFGIVCPKCHNDFWASECLTKEDIDKYSLNELRSWGGRV